MATSYDIKSLSAKFGHSTVYIRRAIGEGKLKTTMVKINSKQSKHVISLEDYKKWRANTVSRSKRTDNRNKFTQYFLEGERKQIEKFMKEKMPKTPLPFRTNQKTSK